MCPPIDGSCHLSAPRFDGKGIRCEEFDDGKGIKMKLRRKKDTGSSLAEAGATPKQRPLWLFHGRRPTVSSRLRIAMASRRRFNAVLGSSGRHRPPKKEPTFPLVPRAPKPSKQDFFQHLAWVGDHRTATLLNFGCPWCHRTTTLHLFHRPGRPGEAGREHPAPRQIRWLSQATGTQLL